MNQKGSLFLTSAIASFMMALVAGYTYELTSTEIRTVHRMETSAQAHQLAEAGLARALSTLAADWNAGASDANFPSTALGPGAYDAVFTTVGGRYLLSSVGTVQGVSRTASAEVTAPVTSALNYGLAGNSVAFTLVGGSSVWTNGGVYGDTTVSLNAQAGSSSVTTGVIDAGGSASTSGAGSISTGTLTSSASLASFPTFNFATYQSIAQSGGGTYYGSSVTFNSGTPIPSPAGGVVYVNGDVAISSNQTTTAAIIATGNITITAGTTTISPSSSSYPAMMTQNGSITISGTGNASPASLTATGLVYSGNNFTITGNHHTVTVTGSIISKGALTGNYSGAAQNDVTVNYVALSGLAGMTGGGGQATSTRSYNR